MKWYFLLNTLWRVLGVHHCARIQGPFAFKATMPIFRCKKTPSPSIFKLYHRRLTLRVSVITHFYIKLLTFSDMVFMSR